LPGGKQLVLVLLVLLVTFANLMQLKSVPRFLSNIM